MSSSLSGDLGLVRVLDPPDVISRKVRSAVTDSGRDVVRSDDKPGVTNLIEIMAVAAGESPEAIEARYDGAGYGKFKEDVGEAVVALFDPIRLRYAELRGDPGELPQSSRAAPRRRTRSQPRRSLGLRARWLRSSLSVRSRSTRPPDGSYRASAGPLARRRLGGRVDWTICWVFFLIA